MRKQLLAFDEKIIAISRQLFVPLARIAFFVVFFYFGFLKVIDVSPASPLAEALVGRTIGLEYFDVLYLMLALIECVIGVLFLIPKATRVVIPLLFFHLLIVCSPILLVPDMAWASWFVPSLEGQYIIKNIVLVAAAIGVASYTSTLSSKKTLK